MPPFPPSNFISADPTLLCGLWAGAGLGSGVCTATFGAADSVVGGATLGVEVSVGAGPLTRPAPGACWPRGPGPRPL